MKNYIIHQVLCNPESYTKTMTFIAENTIVDDKNGYEFSIKGFDSTVVVHQKFNDDQLAGFKKLNIDPMTPLYRAAIQEFIDILMPGNVVYTFTILVGTGMLYFSKLDFITS